MLTEKRLLSAFLYLFVGYNECFLKVNTCIPKRANEQSGEQNWDPQVPYY